MNERLAAIGNDVAARLAAQPGVHVVAGQGIDLYARQNFLTADECTALIALIEGGRRPSTLLSVGHDPAFRTSESCDLDRWHPLVRRIDLRICALMGIEERKGETLQGQRYAVGQQFKAHHDYFPPETDYAQAEFARGGQRSWTAMIYLDEPAAGGETWFPTAGLKASPRTAMLIAWNNMDANGEPNPAALHEGMPVTAGVKHIVTKWYREENWI